MLRRPPASINCWIQDRGTVPPSQRRVTESDTKATELFRLDLFVLQGFGPLLRAFSNRCSFFELFQESCLCWSRAFQQLRYVWEIELFLTGQKETNRQISDLLIDFSIRQSICPVRCFSDRHWRFDRLLLLFSSRCRCLGRGRRI